MRSGMTSPCRTRLCVLEAQEKVRRQATFVVSWSSHTSNIVVIASGQGASSPSLPRRPKSVRAFVRRGEPPFDGVGRAALKLATLTSALTSRLSLTSLEGYSVWRPFMSHGPIFLCGPSRSGTAMLRSALNGHPSVHLAGETHYFDDLRQRFEDPSSGVLSSELASEAADYFCALSHRPYGHHGDPTQGRISPQQLRERAEQLGGTGDAYFQAYCEIEAEQASKSIWGEKTPRHIFRINDILTKFPDAKVVCMSRDPRAVVASYRDWRNQGGFDFE